MKSQEVIWGHGGGTLGDNAGTPSDHKRHFHIYIYFLIQKSRWGGNKTRVHRNTKHSGSRSF